MSNTDPKLTKLFKWVSVCKRFFFTWICGVLSLGYFGVKRTHANPRKKKCKVQLLAAMLDHGDASRTKLIRSQSKFSAAFSTAVKSASSSLGTKKEKKKISPKITKNPIKLPTCFFAPKFDWVFKFPMKVPQQVEKPIKLQRWFPRP